MRIMIRGKGTNNVLGLSGIIFVSFPNEFKRKYELNNNIITLAV
jgi:hypothetical protein